MQKAKELNINVDADVNRRIAEVQSESKISDPEKFHEWLQEELRGVSFEDFKQQTKNQFLTQRVISEEVYRSIIIPKADIEKYYNEHKKDFIREECGFASRDSGFHGRRQPGEGGGGREDGEGPRGPGAQGRSEVQ